METYHLRYALSDSAHLVFDLQRFAGEKTEEPTAKKRADARKKGQVGRSQELNSAFVLLVGFFGLKLLWDSIYLSIAAYTTYVFSNLNQTVDTENILRIFIGIVIVLAKILVGARSEEEPAENCEPHEAHTHERRPAGPAFQIFLESYHGCCLLFNRCLLVSLLAFPLLAN